MSADRNPSPLLDRARRILQPTIILPGLPSRDPIEHLTWAALKADLAQLAGGKPLTFMPGRAAYPGFNDFWTITVRAGGEYLCAVSDRWPGEADLIRALAELRSLA